MDSKKIKICLGLLSNRGFKNKTVISLLKMVNESPEFDWVILESINGYTIAENRNWLAAQSVKNGCDYLLMIDDDMIFPSNTAKVLVSRDKDVIGIPYHTKAIKDGKKDINVMLIEGATLSDTEPNEVTAIGTGVILIKTSVFTTMSQPWFDFNKHENGMTQLGEDFWFCNKAYTYKYKIWSEPTLKDLGHIGDFIY